MSSGGGGGQNTNTQVQQIPAYEQAFSQENQDLARSISSQAYPTYQGQLIAGQNGAQQSGQALAMQAGNNWQPGLSYANDLARYAVSNGNAGTFNSMVSQGQGATQAGQNSQPFLGQATAANAATARGQDASAWGGAYGGAAGAFSAGENGNTVGMAQNAQAGAAQRAQALTNPNAVGAYMNPFVEQALAPQVQDLNLQLASQQQGINAQAAQAGAYGDARQGAMAALQNLYGNQAMNQLIGTGYNNAFTQALQALGQSQNTQLGAAGQYGNIAQTGLGEQNAQIQAGQGFTGLANSAIGQQNAQLQAGQNYANVGAQMEQQQQLQLQAGQQYGNFAGLENQQQNTQLQSAQLQAAIANQQQQQTIAGANAQYNVGQQLQTQQQNELNSAYQQYLNQVNWPFQMLNVREGALSNSPYNIQTATTLPSGNSMAQGFGTLASAAGLIGSLSGAGGGGGGAPFGGARIQ